MRGARTDMMTRDEKLARDLAGGQQERSHQQMGNMLELFDRYDAESKWRKKAIPGAPLPPWQNKSSVANSTASAAIREELWSNRKKIPSTAAAVVQQESHGDVLSPMLHNPNQLRHKQYHEYKTQTQKATQHHNFFCHEGRCHGLQHQHPQQHQKASYGAYTDSTSSSQNVGNTIGTRPTIRQSKLFRMYESGNATKALLGQSDLQWNTDRVEGAYSGSTYDAIQGSVERGYRGGNEVSGDGRDITQRQRTYHHGRLKVAQGGHRQAQTNTENRSNEDSNRWATTSSLAYGSY